MGNAKEEDIKIEIGSSYSLIKTWVKKGRKSGIPVGVRKIILGNIPVIGEPIIACRPTEHAASGDPKKTYYRASQKIVGIKKINGTGWVIETVTSVILLTT